MIVTCPNPHPISHCNPRPSPKRQRGGQNLPPSQTRNVGRTVLPSAHRKPVKVVPQ
jgi:hypothetical protein